MAQLFDIEAKNLIRLHRFYRRAPRQFARAAANVLTSFAFGNRSESLDIIKSKMTVRNERFVKGSVRVEKARGNVPLSAQQSRVGSIQRDRFTGWVEQETGQKTTRTRTSTLLARGGNISRQVRPAFRLKPGNKFASPDDFPGQSPQHRVTVMLQTLSRQKSIRPFIIKGHRKFKSGLYKFLRKKIRRIQTFKNPKQPKRVRWLTLGRFKYFKSTNIDQVWAGALKRVLKF